MPKTTQNTPREGSISPGTSSAEEDSHKPEVIPEKLLEDVFFEPIINILESAGITRKCQNFDDLSFILLVILRVIQSSKSGRDFLQTHGIPYLPDLKRSNYFESLSSNRRLSLVSELSEHLRLNHLPALRAHDDLLAVFPELEGWEVWAADGHKISHATHDPRNQKGQYAPVNGIYKLDMRTGWAEFLALGKPTARGVEHEITTLKAQDPQKLRCGAPKGRSTLLVYDRAVIDFAYAYNIKQSKSIYLLTEWKKSLKPMSCIPLKIDRTNPANDLVISDELLFFNNTRGQWRKITCLCPDSQNGETFTILTNNKDLPPGVLNETYRLRWRIEKAFDQQEQKLEEGKAWAKSENAKSVQALAICIAHNLLLVFTSLLKNTEGIEDSKVIKAYHKQLEKRQSKARKAGRFFPKPLYRSLYRPTEISLQFIRWIRSCLIHSTPYTLALQSLRPLMDAYI